MLEAVGYHKDQGKVVKVFYKAMRSCKVSDLRLDKKNNRIEIPC